MSGSEPWRFERMTWPEADAAANEGLICVVPIGAVEQHGPHLPLDVDMRLVTAVAEGAVRRNGEDALLLPTVQYGYTAHVMDFPGTVNIHYTTFIEFVLDICRSLAHHGFRRILLLNGHGSNRPNLDLASRRANLETAAECAFASWWSFMTVDPEFMRGWRESKFPGGCGHACELETSVYMHLWPDDVRMDLIESGDMTFNLERSPFRFNDLFGDSAVKVTSWTSTYSESGVLGDAEIASAEKGEAAFEEAVDQLAAFLAEWRRAPVDPRRDFHARPVPRRTPWEPTAPLVGESDE